MNSITATLWTCDNCGATGDEETMTMHECNNEHKQPAPEGEEPEHFGATEITELDDSISCSHSDKEWTLSTNDPADIKCDYDYIASATTRKHARQIIRDHRLAALVPGLVEALKEARRLLQACEVHHGYCLTIDAALNAISKESQS